MALWKDQSNAKKDVADPPIDEAPSRVDPMNARNEYSSPAEPMRTSKRADSAESVIGADLAIEGSIVGSGNVRLAGRFTGDVTVEGVVTIEPGAKLAGGIRATSVAIAGELEGNVVEAERVDVLASGVIIGDLKADMLTLAAGSRVRGHIECGWVDAPARGRVAKPVSSLASTSGNVRSITPASSPSHGAAVAAEAERANIA